MEEGSVTVDGVTHVLPKPFICIATQNHYGTAGTQALPESQLDRFMVRLSIGYPERDSQVQILKSRKGSGDLDLVNARMNLDDVKEIQGYLYSIRIVDEILYYISESLFRNQRTFHGRAGCQPTRCGGAGAVCPCPCCA